MDMAVGLALHGWFERNILAYGAVERVVNGGFVLPLAELPALFDRYRWRRDVRREHVEALLRMSLAAVADFEAAMAVADAARDSLVESEGAVRRARSRLRDAVGRALTKHGTTGAMGLPPEAFAAKVEQLAAAREARLCNGLQARLDALELVELESTRASTPPEHRRTSTFRPICASGGYAHRAACSPRAACDAHIQLAPSASAPALPPTLDDEPPPPPTDAEAAAPTAAAPTAAEMAAAVVARARGAVAQLLRAAGLEDDCRVEVIGSSLLYVAADVNVLVVTALVDATVAALRDGSLGSGGMGVEGDDPPRLAAVIDGLRLNVQVLPSATTAPRLLQRTSAIGLWAEVSSFVADNPLAAAFVQTVQAAFATRDMKGAQLGLLPSIAVTVIALNTWLAHKATSRDTSPDVGDAFVYLRERLSFDPTRPDKPPCVRLFDVGNGGTRPAHLTDMPQMALIVLGSTSTYLMTSKMTVLTTRALHLLCGDEHAFDEAPCPCLMMSRQAAGQRIPPLLLELDRLAGDFMVLLGPGGKERPPDAHSSEYVAALLPRWRSGAPKDAEGEAELELCVGSASARRTRQLLDVIERFARARDGDLG